MMYQQRLSYSARYGTSAVPNATYIMEFSQQHNEVLYYSHFTKKETEA